MEAYASVGQTEDFYWVVTHFWAFDVEWRGGGGASGVCADYLVLIHNTWF